METNIKYFIVLLLSTLLSCSKPEPLTSIDKLYPIIDKIEAVDENGYRDIRIYVIDSCEYIGFINAYGSDFLTHKGNCKFCIEKNKYVR